MENIERFRENFNSSISKIFLILTEEKLLYE